jgi:hypothetical protein
VNDTSATLPIIKAAGQGRDDRTPDDIAAGVTASALVLFALILFIAGVVVVRCWQ